ncbi:MAG TPA: sugar phosphate nucleotidyltransferase [Anaerolineaceae bacterium]|nr:sugar phosphate nucleotidyltransferase [Anaerolineaceae bacterium]
MTDKLSIIIPMAGLGSRLRPLTWSRPKPLVSLAGATVLDHLLAMFKSIADRDDVEYVFVMSPGQETLIRAHMQKVHPQVKVHYVEQPEKKGQSDALWHAREFLSDEALILFSDTLIDNDFSFLAKSQPQAIAWVKAVPDPRRFGVAEVDAKGQVSRLIEKPNDMNNNLAVVGCYYFPDGKQLISAIEEQVQKKISLKGEYFLVDAINLMLEKNIPMRIEQVRTWLDAGTSEALLDTNRHLLEHGCDRVPALGQLEDTVIIPPVYIHPEARVSTSIIGPFVSVGAGSLVQHSSIRDSILSPGAHITNANLEGSLLGYDVVVNGLTGKFNLGDNSWANY